MKKILLLITLLMSALTFAQNNGITYQAVIYSASGESIPGIQNPNSPLVNKAICLQFSVIDSNTQTEYQERVAVTTDSYGMVNLVIGNGTQTGGYASSFNSIVWSNSKKYLKVSLDQAGNCTSFELISNQLLTYVPFALAADIAASVSGIVGIANGGTNATTVVGAKTNLQLQNVDNTSDLNKPVSTATQNALNSKVDKVAGKDLSTNDFTTVEKTKLAAISGVNTGDQDLSSYATLTNLDTKVDKVAGKDLSTNDFTTTEKTKLAAISGVNTGDQDLSSYATLTNLVTKVDKVAGKDLSTNDFTTTEKTKLAAISGVNTGDQDLSSYATLINLGSKVDKVAGKDLSTEDFTTAEKTKLASLNGAPDLSGYVPFNGAQRNLNLGNNNLQAIQVTTNNLSVGSVNGMVIGMKGTGETNILGSSSMAYASGGFANTAFGHLTLSETQGDENTALGSQAMRSSTTGSRNTAVGRASLNGNLSGNNNTALGYNTRVSANNLSNTTAIGANAIVGTSNTIQLGDTNVTDVKTSGKLTTGTITLPNIDGTSGQVLSTNGVGVVSWSTPSSVNTSNFVDLTTNQTIAGNKTFSATSIGLQLNTDSYGSKVMKVGFPNYGGNNRNSYKSVTLGVDALKSLLYGDNEIAIGYNALYNDVRGTENIAIGNYSLFTTNYDNITNSWAQNNVVMGNYSGYNMTSGKHNVLMGWQSGYSLNRGSNNTIIGPNASGFGIETGNNNTIIGRAIGLASDLSNNIILANGNATVGAQFDGTNWTMAGTTKATGFKTPTGTSSQYLMADGSVTTSSGASGVDLVSNQTIAGIKTFSTDIIVDGLTIGSGAGTAANTALGYQALYSNTGGDNNTAIGNSALRSNTGGVRNTATGIDALRSNTSGGENTASGYFSLKFNNGNKNTATGYESLLSNTSGTRNTGLGVQALRSNSTGSDNTATGNTALDGNTSGINNTANGAGALFTNNIGSRNTALGYNTGLGITSGDNNTILGANVGATPNTALAAGLSNNIILANGTGAIKAQHDGTDWTLTGGLTAGGITYPKINGINGQVLTADGVGNASWKSNNITSAISHGYTNDLLNVVSVGNLKFRFNSSNMTIEVQAVSNSLHGQVYATKKTYDYMINSSSSSIKNYRSDESFSSNSWKPFLSLWDGTAYTGIVTLNGYETIEAHIHNLGIDATPVLPNQSYKLFVTLDGYNLILMRVELVN